MSAPALFTLEQHVGRLTLNRPQQFNAMDLSLVEAMITHVTEAAQMARSSEVRVLILAGQGDRAFCAGADMEARRSMTESDRARHLDLIAMLCRSVYEFPVPVIAEIHGHCIGGGLELALACDMRFADESARFSLPEVKLGMLARSSGAVFAQRQIPHGALAEMLFTGDRIPASRALEIGLVNRVLGTRVALSETTATIAAAIAAAAPGAVRSTKELLLAKDSTAMQATLQLGDRLHEALASSQDLQEGLAALQERRAPVFTGR